MKRFNPYMLLAFVLAGAPSFCLGGEADEESRLPSTPSAVLFESRQQALFVAESRARLVTRIDRDLNIDFRTALPGMPTGLIAWNDRLWVSAEDEQGRGHLFGLDQSSGDVLAHLTLGHGSTSPVIDARQGLLYLANSYSGDVSMVDLRHTPREGWRVPVQRSPERLLWEPGRLWVAHLLPNGASNREFVAASLLILNPESGETIKEITLPNGTTAVRDLVMSPDDRFVVVSHTLARYQVPVSHLDRGWISNGALTLIDRETLAVVHTVLLDETHRGAPSPWGIAFSPEGTTLLVAHSGTHDVSIIDYPALVDRLGHQAITEPDFSTLAGIRQRIDLPGKGPRAVTATNDGFAVAEFFTGSINWVPFAGKGSGEPRGLNLQSDSSGTVSASFLGEQIFHDADRSFQGWVSCSTCHLDGRMDGLNWDLLGDGAGNPKNTKSLLLAHDTLPMGYDGSRPQVEGSTWNSFRFILYHDAPPETTTAVDAYIQSLEILPAPSPRGEKALTEISAGKQIFSGKAGCIDCHSGPYFTDGKLYDLTNERLGDGRLWETPPLVEMWRSGPYLHDGRAATLEELFVAENHGDIADQLSQTELNQLIQFVLQL